MYVVIRLNQPKLIRQNRLESARTNLRFDDLQNFTTDGEITASDENPRTMSPGKIRRIKCGQSHASIPSI